MSATNEKWFVLKARNTKRRYGFGTATQAREFCDFFNRGRDANPYETGELDDEYLIDSLKNPRDDGIDLETWLIQ